MHGSTSIHPIRVEKRETGPAREAPSSFARPCLQPARPRANNPAAGPFRGVLGEGAGGSHFVFHAFFFVCFFFRGGILLGKTAPQVSTSFFVFGVGGDFCWLRRLCRTQLEALWGPAFEIVGTEFLLQGTQSPPSNSTFQGEGIGALIETLADKVEREDLGFRKRPNQYKSASRCASTAKVEFDWVQLDWQRG